MLLDPFEKQLDLPPAAIKLGDGECWQGEIVGKEHQPLAGCGVFESDATQRRVEVLTRVEAGEHDGLIANQARASIDRMRITTLGFEVGFGAGDKEAFRLVQLIKPFEVDVSSVHDVESAGLGNSRSRTLTSCSLPSLMWRNEGMLPRRSNSVCNLMAALVERNGAQGNTDRHRSMVPASRA